MTSSRVQFLIQPAGKGGMKVVKVELGSSRSVFTARRADLAHAIEDCVSYLRRVMNAAESADVQHAAEMAILREEELEVDGCVACGREFPVTAPGCPDCDPDGSRRRSMDETDDRMDCRVCGKPVDEDDACDEHLDVHSDCEPEFIAMRADAVVDRMIDAALLGEARP